MIRRAYCRGIIAADFVRFLSPMYLPFGEVVLQFCVCCTGVERFGLFIHLTDLAEMIFGENEE